MSNDRVQPQIILVPLIGVVINRPNGYCHKIWVFLLGLDSRVWL